MALIDFALTQRCVIYPWLREAAGEDIYGDPEVRKCRIQIYTNLKDHTKNAHGPVDDEAANAKMFCTGSTIPTRSRIECDGESYIVLKCYRERGFKLDHLEVMLE